MGAEPVISVVVDGPGQYDVMFEYFFCRSYNKMLERETDAEHLC